jgi:hypothetical protein
LARSPDSARLKIRRARDHVATLQFAIQRFANSRPATFYVDPNFDRIEEEGCLLRLRVTAAPPTDYWAAIVGDALTNAFDALDHAICALSSRPSCEGLGFPMFASEKEWEQPWKENSTETCVEHLTRGVAPTVVTSIEELQPYPGRDQRLWHLKRLTNHDKHRAIHVVAMTADLSNLALRQSEFLAGLPPPRFEVLWQRQAAIEDEAVVAGFRTHGLIAPVFVVEMHMDPSFSIQVLFGQDTPEVPGCRSR